jgi:hypothetical protein
VEEERAMVPIARGEDVVVVLEGIVGDGGGDGRQITQPKRHVWSFSRWAIVKASD